MNYNFNEMSYNELKDIKAEVMEIMKGKKEEKKEADKEEKEAIKIALEEEGKKLAIIGGIVSCTYKGDKVIGTIIKINPKTVSVKLSDVDGNEIVNNKGKQVVTWKYLYQIFPIAE